jgi:N-dimethylarginine dimethylaminohydrolase
MRDRCSRRDAIRVLTGSVLAAALPGCRGTQSPSGPEAQLRPLRVQNEFGALRTALVHDGSNATDITLEEVRRAVPPCELSDHPESGTSRRDQVIRQHAAFRRVLVEHGVSLLSPETQKGAFCQVFARDPCFVIGDTLFLGRLRDAYRHAETTGLTALRAQARTVVDLSGDGATIEGGDVMVLDAKNRVLIGMNRHTNEAGCSKLALHLAGTGVEVIRVPHRALHLDCCLAPLPNGEAIYCASKLSDSSVEVLRRCFTRLIALDRNEAELRLAANLFWISERQVASNAAASQTNRLLRDRGYEVIELDFSHLVRMWGSFRCVVCPLERA